MQARVALNDDEDVEDGVLIHLLLLYLFFSLLLLLLQTTTHYLAFIKYLKWQRRNVTRSSLVHL